MGPAAEFLSRERDSGLASAAMSASVGSAFFLMGFFFSVRRLTFDHDRCMSASSIFSDINLARAVRSSPSPAIAAKPDAIELSLAVRSPERSPTLWVFTIRAFLSFWISQLFRHRPKCPFLVVSSLMLGHGLRRIGRIR